MRKLFLSVVLVSLTASAIAQTNTSCTALNVVAGPFVYGKFDYTEHNFGNHNWSATMGGSCRYSGNNPNVACLVAGTAQSTTTKGDAGSSSLNNVLYHHELGTSTAGGAGSSNGPTVTTDTEAAFSVRSCLISCGVSIGISGSGLGGGFSVSVPSDAIFNDKQHYTVVCAGPEYPAGSGCTQVPSGQTAPSGDISVCGPSPIVISTKRGVDVSKSFTDPTQKCVTFNLKNDGKPACYSWPEKGSGVAFLVYDRDSDGGVIDSGSELFGDFTPHADGGVAGHPNPNGFLALAWYDKPAQGGDGNLEITPKDAIWKHLKLWLPDHCWDSPELPCASIPKELHSLESEGIHSLGLMYGISQDHDQWGNSFKFYAQVNPKPHDMLKPDDEMNERRSWDVFLASRP